MFNQSSGRFRPSGFTIDSSGNTSDEPYYVSDRKSSRLPFSFKRNSLSSHGTGPATKQSTSDMDWTPHTSVHHPFNHGEDGQFHGSPDAMDFEDLEPVHSHESGSISRLISRFENKLDNTDPSPPLPPRPINNNNTYNHNINHVGTSIGTSSSMSSYFGSLNAAAHSKRIPSPITSPTESTFGSFGIFNRVTSPFDTTTLDTTSSYLSFGSSFQDLASPDIGSSSTPFGSLDDFAHSTQLDSPMDSGPIAPMSHQPSLTPTTVGTPGFEVWRPPGSSPVKRELPQESEPSQEAQPHPPFQPPRPSQHTLQRRASALNSPFTKPPVPPKPNIPFGSQFILEYNHKAAKPKGKAPVKPARLRMPPPPPPPRPRALSTSSSTAATPQIKPDPDALSPPTIPSTPSVVTTPRQALTSLRPHAGTRPSREQVPIEAWELHKATIRHLYLEERKPLKEVMSIMAQEYGFQATPKMYKTRFSQWGFVKNNTEDEVKRLLSMKFQRDAEGKVSEFVRNGKVINIGTYLKRKGVTEYDLVDFELPANLPAYIRCRTPTPPLSTSLRSPDLIKAQELILGCIRRSYIQSRQHEIDTNTKVGWSVIQVWGALSSELLLEANFYFEAGDSDNGGQILMRAFNQLEHDLKQLSPQGVNEILLGMVNRDMGVVTALCKYLSAYASTNMDKAHPLRQIFSALYEIQQKHGSETLSKFLSETVPIMAEEMEAIYSRKHPYVTRFWLDLALVYNHVQKAILDQLILELRVVQREVGQANGGEASDVVVVKYAIMQLLYACGPQSDAAKQAAIELWDLMRNTKVVFAMRDARPNAFCYHSPVKVDPWTKRCRRRYDSGVTMLEEHVNVKIHPYFEEEFHMTQHVPEAQDAWASAMNQQSVSNRWNFL